MGQRIYIACGSCHLLPCFGAAAIWPCIGLHGSGPPHIYNNLDSKHASHDSVQQEGLTMVMNKTLECMIYYVALFIEEVGHA
jgi:hypothetical protein